MPPSLKQVQEILDLGLFQSDHSQLNHHKRDSQITRSKISYRLMEPQSLPRTSCGYEFNALAVYTHHSAKHVQLDPSLESDRKSAEELFCRSSQGVKTEGCFRRGALLLMFDGVLNATLSEENVSTATVTQGNLELPLPPISLDLNQTKKQ